MSRNGFPMAPRKAARWTSHLRQFSRAAVEALPEGEVLSSEMDPSSLYASTHQPTMSPQRPHSPDSVSSSATIREPLPAAKQTPDFERTCIVTVNEGFTRDEVLMNLDHFDSVQPGQLMAIDVLPDQRPGFGSYRRTTARKDEHASSPAETADAATTSSAATADGAASQPELDTQRRYLFIVKDMPAQLKSRHPSVEIYVAKHIADVFGMKKGSAVLLTRASIYLIRTAALSISVLGSNKPISCGRSMQVTLPSRRPMSSSSSRTSICLGQICGALPSQSSPSGPYTADSGCCS